MTKRKKQNKKALWFTLLGLTGTGLFSAIIVLLARDKDIPLLDPKGAIADEQYRLLLTSTGIMVAFAAIVLFFIYFFAWKYRETNQNTVHNPRAGRSKLLLLTAWAAPIMVCAVLTAIMLPATQKLEPQESIESDTNELTIRVVAMRWKWLFMYPDQDIATVNYVQIPVDTPVRFELTADEAPMNGFWIPHLGGMLYAMTEHVNPLNLIAHTTGEYDGGASEVNGHGFADMRFKAHVTSREEFDKWVGETHRASKLGAAEYAQLLKPSEDNPAATYYSPTNQEIFDAMLKKYAGGSHNHYNELEDQGHEGH